MSFRDTFASQREGGAKEFTWQGRRYHTRTAEDESAGRTKWDDSAKKWVKPGGEAKEMAHGGAVHAYQDGGKVGGMFDFPTKNSRD